MLSSAPCPQGSKLKRKRGYYLTKSGVYFARRSTPTVHVVWGKRGLRVVAGAFGAGVYFANTGMIPDLLDFRPFVNPVTG